MAAITQNKANLQIETDAYHAAVRTEGYVSGVMAGSFADKKTDSRDPGFGLMIADFLLEPGEDDETTPEDFRYEWNNLYHGKIPKRYVERPQICTQAKRLSFEVIEGSRFVAVRQRFTWTEARPPYQPGSTWEQTLVFPDGVRWFLTDDHVTSVNSVGALALRTDMPGHLKHTNADTFRRIYLSYHGEIPSDAFLEDFPPHERYLYRRDDNRIPTRFIRGYQLAKGAWLAGMALEPSTAYESWCHQRGYVCFIHEIGGRPIRAGESFNAVHLIGYFEDIPEMEAVYDDHKGATALRVNPDGWSLV